MTDWLQLALERKGTVAQRPPPPLPVQLVPPPLPAYVQRPLLPPQLPPPVLPLTPPGGIISTTNWLELATERSGGGGPNAVVDQELARILALPYIAPDIQRCPDRRAYEMTLLSHACPATFRLHDVQIDLVYTYQVYGGVLGPLGTGWGKTLCSLMVAKVGLQRRGHQRACIMVPPEVFDQLTKTDLPDARRKLALDGIPFWIVKGGPQERMRTAMQPGPGVFIYSYSSLSTQTGYQELMAISPTLLIQDEAHNLASPSSARTKRWATVATEIAQAVQQGKYRGNCTAKAAECVAMSGTITKKKIADYAHLARRCLREQSPVPIRDSSIAAFGNAVDADVLGTGMTDLDRYRMDLLIRWAREHGFDPLNEPNAEGVFRTLQEATREAYQLRLRTSPCVVATGDASVGCSLIIAWSEPPRPRTVEADQVAELMKKVCVDMVTPDGDVIDYGMHSFKWLWELTAGFFNSLTWPTEKEIISQHLRRGKVISEKEATTLIIAAKEHNKLLQVYHKKLRIFLDDQMLPGCDTPMLVGQELTRLRDGKAPRFHLPSMLINAYNAHKDALYDDLPERHGKPVRLCSYKIDAAVQWCRAHAPQNKGPGGLVWYHHPAVGNWLHEKLVEAEIQHTMAGAGQNEAAYAMGLVICSYAHATGKNLQKQSRNLVVELRREATIMEQMISRTHRSGQDADDVRADVFVSNGFDLALFNAILRDADYIQSTTGMKQRLCYATYAPVIPPTSAHLAHRLGIIPPDQAVAKRMVAAQDAITPPEALDITSVFRSLAFVQPLTPGAGA